MQETILSFNHISKSFPGVRALDDINMQFRKGEIHAIVGENGAGKSTLIKILSGAHQPSEGTLEIMGVTFTHLTPRKAIEKGISVIYQEFQQIPYLSVAENIFYGRETSRFGLLNRRYMNEETLKLCKEMGVNVNPKLKVQDLGVAYQQIVEIIKAISKDTRILVMDEPTAPLTNVEIKLLFEVVRKLKAKGVTILYISHRLEEVFELCDRVSVIRDGKFIITKDTDQVTRKELIGYMIGRSLSDEFPGGNGRIPEIVLSVRNLKTDRISGVSFDLFKGEILGIGGLVGSGRTETARALFGADPLIHGEIEVFGQKRIINSPRDAIKFGIGFLPEDRKRQGLVLSMQVKENISFGILRVLSKFGFISDRRERSICNSLKDSLKIKTPKLAQITRNLSGGNQQKVVLAKWLAMNSDIFIFDEPTRGIDVGAKQEIYNLMHDLTAQGKSIIMISSEMPELIGMSDRMIIMHEGHISGEINQEEFSQQAILEIASGA